MGKKLFGGVALALMSAAALAAPLGQFAGDQDIGSPPRPGSASFDAKTGTYRITGFGRNMWADHDDFHFVWKRMSGDVAAETRLDFVTPAPKPGATGFLHRKGGVVLRQDLDPDSAYVDALRMGNAQMSLQYREVKGGPTRLIWINTAHQAALRLVKIGDYAYLAVPGADGRLHATGGSFKVHITGPYYIGLGVCPHDDAAHETMDFRDVRIAPARGVAKPAGETLQTINVATVAEQTALYHSAGRIDAGGWSPDGKWVYFSADGQRRRAVAWDSDVVEAAPDAAPAAVQRSMERIGSDGTVLSSRLSPDGKTLAYLVAPHALGAASSDVELKMAPVANGEAMAAKAVTLVKLWGGADSLPRAAWSPDGKTLSFVSHD